jgi:outer membrane protein OmpA-like peptidoglycan-associated protein
MDLATERRTPVLTPKTDTAAWRPVGLAFPLLAATFLLTSCVSGGDGDPGGSGGETTQSAAPEGSGGENGEPLASSLTSSMIHGSNLRIDINSLEREGNGVVVLEMSASNVGEQGDINFEQALTAADGQHRTPDGVTLIDTANRERYFPLQNTDGQTCLCSSYSDFRIGPGESLDFWAAYPEPPADVSSVAVATSITPDFMDIPLTDAEQPDEDIANAAVGEPRILPLSAFQDDIDGGSSREESGDQTSIMLASDVLFDLNESTLTSEADEALEQVAAEIDASEGDTVSVDGYTDNSGNDSINQPLSEDRAESVRDRLEELVTRDGVSFDTNGHGSSDPVADNSTEEGREKNRRVTVSFEK